MINNKWSKKWNKQWLYNSKSNSLF
jgi:hypothetical protein